MTPIEQLRKAAREKRDTDIQRAKDEYRQTIRELSAMARRLGKPGPRKPRRQSSEPEPAPDNGDFSGLTVKRAAELLLIERGPQTLAELVVEIQARGLREGDDPHAVARAVVEAFRYHRGRFKRDEAGRWAPHSSNQAETSSRNRRPPWRQFIDTINLKYCDERS